ncbi:CDK5 regulatory subunit-associated protein 1 [Rhynchospora pubera]|uniref:CDK5 regulatory subunit-associated protein 1 n=1 Tax=Rhynchospora pubera TaxID=906938 RepID=A0AAV8FDQ1_9POAL|nr:CDK5 regulatory subunit-associated protein 1 [Rhynchospora pubera]
MMSSQGLAIAATAMAVSGTVVLLTLCRQKPLLLSLAPLSLDPTSQSPSLSLRPCIKNSMDAETRRREKNKRKKKKSGKRVQFSDRVEESCRVRAQMPANQMALYRGILRDRLHRVPACTY